MTLATLQPLQKKLLSENVVGAIRTAILNRDLEMGQRLVETELAEQLALAVTHVLGHGLLPRDEDTAKK